MGKGPLSATVRGALCGTLGGVAGAVVDYAMVAGPSAQFLPDGSQRLLAFLVGLYGAAGGIVGAMMGLLSFLLGRYTDLGPLVGFARDRGDDRGAPWLAYAVAAGATSAALGMGVRQLTSLALVRFHSPLLISAWVGLLGAAMAAALVVATLLLAPALAPILRFGPRVRVRALPVGLLVPGWLIGLGLGGAGLARLVFALQHTPRMTAASRAGNAGSWAPVMLGAGFLVAHFALGRFAPRGEGGAIRLLARPAIALGLVAGLLSSFVAGTAAVAWSIVKLLPIQAAAVGAVAVFAGLGFAVALAERARPGLPGTRAGQAALLLLMPLLMFLIALQAGRADRALKAASEYGALAGPLLDGLHAAWDLDHDGYSALLGPDCNDLDPDVHPGAFDWPDDGIDQNCNGHEATLSHKPRPPFPALPDSVPRRPNVVLISIDALRADHVGAYGYARPTTPRIDELARESVLFRNGWAHSPSTRFSVPAILTGRYESTIAWGSPAEHWPPRVLPENRLLSEMFKDHGYHTGAILPAHYFERGWGLTQGFDEYDNSLATRHSNVRGDPARATGDSSRELADLGVRWVAAAAQQKDPFFLWMHFFDPHYLYEKHAEVPDFGDDDAALYDSEIRYTDLHIGRLLDAIKAAGVWNDTVVILTADHGEGFGEHGVRRHGYHVYVQQNKVPFILKIPGVSPGIVDEPVGHVDLFPTLLNLLRAADEPQLLGRSLFDLLLGTPASEPRLVFQEVDYEGPTSRKAVASRTHQLIANVVPDGTFELYDLERDPAEAHDEFVRGAGGEQARLYQVLGEWMDEIALPRDFKARVADNLSTQPMATETALGAKLGGLLVIDGVDVKTKVVRPGEQAEVDLVLHVPARLPAGWRMFTHARAARGPYFLNLDHQPVEGFVPLDKLRPGQWVRDRIRFTLPPGWPGDRVDVEVGLFRGAVRAPASGPGAAADHVRVATLSVAR